MERKSVIITGSNRGIGRAMVQTFAEANYDIWACARKKNEDFESDMQELAKKTGVVIKTVYFDLSIESEIRDGIKKIFEDKKRIDVLINNAAIPHGALFTMTSLEEMRKVYEINIFAQVQLTQAIARKMMRQKKGCVINMCSVGGIETNPGYLAYGSSKAALIWITKALSKELGQYGIRVNGIAPGLIDTEMGNYKSKEEMDKVIDRTSLKTIGKPNEIAKAALYMASEDASYMTGHIMILDGGRV